MLVPFLFGVTAFTGLGSTIDSLFDIIRRVGDGLPLLAGLQFYLLSIPKVMVLTFPMSVLLATLMVYGRMSAENELVALRSCGVSPLRLVMPAIAMGLLVTGLTFSFNEAIVPTVGKQLDLTKSLIYGFESRAQNSNIFYQELLDRNSKDATSQGSADERQYRYRLFFARGFDGDKTMRGITFLDFTSEYRTIVVAQSGVWLGEEEGWEFSNGTKYSIDDDGYYHTVSQFQREIVNLSRSPITVSIVQRPDSLNIAELQDYIELREQAGHFEKGRSLRMELQSKYATPFACLTFGLLGALLGMSRRQRSNSAIGFSLSILVILAYYTLFSVAKGLGHSGALSPSLAAWLPNLIICIVAVFLLRALSR